MNNKHSTYYYDSNESLKAPDVIKSIDYNIDYLEMDRKDIIFTTGVGNHQMQTYQFIKCQYPRKILSSGSLGVMGTGLPYAVGAQIANPNKLIVDIDGDSSFNMTMSDLKKIIQEILY